MAGTCKAFSIFFPVRAIIPTLTMLRAASRMPFFYRRRRRNRIHRAGHSSFFRFDSFDARMIYSREHSRRNPGYMCRRLKQINRRRHPARFRVRSRALIRYIKNIAKLNFAAIEIHKDYMRRHVFPTCISS